jgi:hypothetical protein
MSLEMGFTLKGITLKPSKLGRDLSNTSVS